MCSLLLLLLQQWLASLQRQQQQQQQRRCADCDCAKKNAMQQFSFSFSHMDSLFLLCSILLLLFVHFSYFSFSSFSLSLFPISFLFSSIQFMTFLTQHLSHFALNMIVVCLSIFLLYYALIIFFISSQQLSFEIFLTLILASNNLVASR